MSTSIRTVLFLAFSGACGALSACGGYVNLGDPAEAGAGGEGGSPVEETVGGTTGEGGSAASPTSEAGAGPTSGDAGAGTDGSPEAGAGGESAIGTPYAPRSGSFNMLVYSRTMGFRHESSLATGKKMLEAIAAEQGFEVTLTETNEQITPEGLSHYEIVFFLNPTGDVFGTAEEEAFEAWMTTKNGAFAGVHSATDTELGWPFYQEVTGQYFDLHGPAATAGQVLIEDAGLAFPGLSGLPNPWQRVEEWYRFNKHEVWSAKPGFEILARNAADNHPVVWTRQYDNFRSFYTSLGHDGAVFEDDLVKRMIAGGIMWAVRREHLFE